jgi:very-short-patch-repair endonuclease
MTGKTPLSPARPALLVHARTMRRAMTAPERKLWAALRNAKLAVKVRRQVPLGPFIADFYAAAAKRVIEVDGVTHADCAGDASRDAWFAARGVLAIRFVNADVMRNVEGVVRRIAEVIAVRATPSPQPSPARGEGV